MTKRERKAAHKALIHARIERALSDLYHNATPSLPDFQNDYEAHLFQSCFSDYASSEIGYIQSGGAYCDIRKTANDYIAKKYQNPATGRLAARLYCKRADIERAKYAPWESISDYGRLYQYGRGGRTLAPEKLIRQRGGSSFSINEEYFSEFSLSSVTEAVRIIESFNSFVESLNNHIPAWWQEEKEANEYQAEIDAHD